MDEEGRRRITRRTQEEKKEEEDAVVDEEGPRTEEGGDGDKDIDLADDHQDWILAGAVDSVRGKDQVGHRYLKRATADLQLIVTLPFVSIAEPWSSVIWAHIVVEPPQSQ